MITPDQLRAARKLLGWSQKTLAKKTGVPFSWLHRFENGSRARTQGRLVVIAATLQHAGIDFADGGATINLRTSKSAAPREPQ